MYRLNYPDAPGMHNRETKRNISNKNRRFENFDSVWSEIIHKRFSFLIIFLLLISFLGLHTWNENRASGVSRAVYESLGSIKKLPSAEYVLDENDGKLVHVVGSFVTEKELQAMDYGISVNAVKLRQKLQMYQWVEENNGNIEGNSEKAASFVYYKTWVDRLVDSESFHVKNIYENPKNIPEIDSLEVADVVKIGKFRLCKELVDKIENFKPVTGHIRPQSSSIKLHAGYYYHTDDIWKPQIGDFRVAFEMAGMSGEQAELVTVIAKQKGNMLIPYVTTSGKSILILKFGRKNPEDMIHVELSTTKLMTWMTRVFSWLALMFAFSKANKFLDSMEHVNPFLRDILNLGSTHFCLSLTWMAYTMILGAIWTQHRTILGLGFILFSMLPIFVTFIKIYLKDNSENMRHHAA